MRGEYAAPSDPSSHKQNGDGSGEWENLVQIENNKGRGQGAFKIYQVGCHLFI